MRVCVCVRMTTNLLTLTQVTGIGKPFDLPRAILMQIKLQCRCRVEHCNIYSHSTAVICGKRFTAGEFLRCGKRCGSVVTRVVGGRSIYGLVKHFIRLRCDCIQRFDFGLITWFPHPVYPDNDPLTVRINLGGININNINNVNVTTLNCIQPSRVAVSIDETQDCIYPIRLEGLDTMNIT